MSKSDLSQALPVGAVLHGGKYDYTVESVLGKGGFGFTYLVSTYVRIENIDVKLLFAVKEHFVSTLSSRLSGNNVESSQPVKVQVEGSLKDFRSEAKRLKSLSGRSPYIVKVNESFDANNTAYYVMEYIDGQGLNDLIKTAGPLSESQAVGLIKAVLDAVGIVHEARMTHLDIKPANILLASSSNNEVRPVLIDFGLAKHYDSAGNATSTLNTVGCSDGYAPIEQYGGLKTFAPTADIYAVGATLYTMLTGKKPPTATDVDHDLLDEEMRRLGVSEAVRKTVLKAMEYKAAERFQSVPEFVKSLEGSDGHEVVVEPVDDEQTRLEVKVNHEVGKTAPTVRKKSKTNLWMIIGGVIVILIAGVVTWLLINSADTRHDQVVPEPKYSGYGPSDIGGDVDVTEETDRVDYILNLIRESSSMDELHAIARQYSDYVSTLPREKIDLLESAAGEKMSEFAYVEEAFPVEEDVEVAAVDSVDYIQY